tara:strand:- start:40173 stop:40355 length:183 start_codon:yes stop_codon:yes gene_type:complete
MKHLMPQSIIDSYYTMIKKTMDIGGNPDRHIKNLLKINKVIPSKIQELIDDNNSNKKEGN